MPVAVIKTTLTKVQELSPETLRKVLLWITFFSVLLFPLGRAFQVSGPLLALPVLGLFFWKDHTRTSWLPRPLLYTLGILFACITAQILFSHWTGTSWTTVSPNFSRGYLMLFIALACIRTEQDLRLMLFACLGAIVGQGVDGVWQYLTGHDFIKNAPLMSGRLTASMGTYRVGDYIGIMLLPTLGLWYLLPVQKKSVKLGLTLLILSPALFLWIFAQARTGYLAFAGGLYLSLCILQKPNWKTVVLPLCAIALLVLFGPQRISLATAMADGRIPIWGTAWETFQGAPWTGWGAGCFLPAYQAMGFSIAEAPMQHPHNIYLQFLIDGGIPGFLTLLSCFTFLSLWMLGRIKQGLRQNQPGQPQTKFWYLTLFFWAGWIGFLIVGFSGHDFYRTWYVSTGFTLLGIALAACIHGPKDTV